MNLNNEYKNLSHKVYFYFLLLVALLISLTCFLKSNIVLADKGLTNVNQVTDFFNKELGEKQQLENFLEGSKKQAEGGIGNKSALTELGSTESELENKTAELNSISANSLESKGQEERYKEANNYYNALEVDYSDPKVTNHKKDIDLIVDGSTKLIARLIDGLADLGINCKMAKGNKEIEPEYAIEIKKEHYKDTIYNQHICESLRNQYNCTDSITLHCLKKGGDLKETIIPIIHDQTPKAWWHVVNEHTSGHNWWSNTGHLLIREDDPVVQQQIKQYIADKLHIPVQYVVRVQIEKKREKVEILFMWESLVCKNFIVTYRSEPEGCLQWQESLDERCILQ